MTDSVLGTALAFARHGHAVFPIHWPVDRGGKLVCSCGGDSRGHPMRPKSGKAPLRTTRAAGLVLGHDKSCPHPELVQPPGT